MPSNILKSSLSEDFIILVWRSIRLVPNLLNPPRGIKRNKEKLTLPIINERGEIGKEGVTLARADEPSSLHHRVPFQRE